MTMVRHSQMEGDEERDYWQQILERGASAAAAAAAAAATAAVESLRARHAQTDLLSSRVR